MQSYDVSATISCFPRRPEGHESASKSKDADSKCAGRCVACDGKLLVFEPLAYGTKERPLLGGDPRSNPPQVPPSIEGILGNRFDGKVVGFQVGVPQLNAISLLPTLTSNGAIDVFGGGNRTSEYPAQARFESPGVVIYLAPTRQLGLEAQISAPRMRKVRHGAHPFFCRPLLACGLAVTSRTTNSPPVPRAGTLCPATRMIGGGCLRSPIGNRNGGVVTVALQSDKQRRCRQCIPELQDLLATSIRRLGA